MATNLKQIAANVLLKMGYGQSATEGAEEIDGDISDSVDSEESREPKDPTLAFQEFPSLEELKWIGLINDRFTTAQAVRMVHEREWILCIAFKNGYQWLGWRAGQSALTDLRDAQAVASMSRAYSVSNKMTGLIDKNVSRACSARIDGNVLPYTTRPIDLAAADEGRAVIEHCDADLDEQALMQSMIDWAATTGLSFRETYWDPNKKADVWTGESAVSAEVGGVVSRVVPAPEVYKDPKGTTLDTCQWVDIVQVVSKTYCDTRWPWAKDYIKADAVDGHSTYIETQISAIYGEQNAPQSRKNAVTLHTMYERPSDMYPTGKMVVMAGGRIVENTTLEWFNNDFPLIELMWRDPQGAAYPNGLASQLVPLQADYNYVLSRIRDRIDSDFPTILLDDRAMVDTDELTNPSLRFGAKTSPSNYRRLFYRGGAQPPIFASPPQPGSYWYEYLNLVWRDMQDAAAVHDASNGIAGTTDPSSLVIDTLQQADNQQIRCFLTHLESFMRKLRTQQIWLYERFASEARLMRISQDPDEQTSSAQVVAFKALGKGGKCNVVIEPGSSIPRTPAGQMAQLMMMAKNGLLSPEQWPVLKLLIPLMKLEGGNKLVQNLEALIKEEQASQPSEQEIEAQKAQQSQQALAIQSEIDQQHAAIKLHSDQVLSAQEFQQKLELIREAAKYPSLSGAFKLDSAATAAVEEELGLPSNEAEIAKMNVPQKAPGGTSKK